VVVATKDKYDAALNELNILVKKETGFGRQGITKCICKQ